MTEFSGSSMDCCAKHSTDGPSSVANRAVCSRIYGRDGAAGALKILADAVLLEAAVTGVVKPRMKCCIAISMELMPKLFASLSACRLVQ